MLVIDDSASQNSTVLTAISIATRTWNNVLNALSSNLGIKICIEGSANCTNQDQYKVHIKVVEGTPTNNKSPYNMPDYPDCGYVTACVKTTDPTTYGDGLLISTTTTRQNIFADDSPAHLEHMTIIIEDPAFQNFQMSESYTEIEWGNDPNASDNTYYLPSTMMHEIGHTLGLVGHRLTNASGLDEGLMDLAPETFLTPTNSDTAPLINIYQNHIPHAATPPAHE